MGWKKWKQNGTKLFDFGIIQPFHILTSTLLTLLLPLSFLLISRLSTASYLLSLAPSSQIESYSVPIFIFYNLTPNILYALVSLISSFSLIHALTGQITLINRSPESVFHLPLYVSWFLLCIFQICVGFGIEGSVAVGTNDSGFTHEISLASRVVFFLGLHETMAYWSKMVVRPVVDDTILGFRQEERWPERVAVAVGFGGLWWWRLKGEIESLVIMVEVKKELMINIGLGDFVGWWLYYLTVTIGVLKFLKLVMWFAAILFFKRVEANTIELSSEIDEKV